MFISKEFKAAMEAFRDAMRIQRESESKGMPIKKLQLLAIANGIFGLVFSFGDNYLITAEMVLLTTFFWSLALWLHLATPKGSKENWPPQFKTFKDIRVGFFKLENYPKLKNLFKSPE